jgi:hypothetical protein
MLAEALRSVGLMTQNFTIRSNLLGGGRQAKRLFTDFEKPAD